MSFVRDQKPATTQAPIDITETTGAGPLVPQAATPTYSYKPVRTSLRSFTEPVVSAFRLSLPSRTRGKAARSWPTGSRGSGRALRTK